MLSNYMYFHYFKDLTLYGSRRYSTRKEIFVQIILLVIGVIYFYYKVFHSVAFTRI